MFGGSGKRSGGNDEKSLSSAVMKPENTPKSGNQSVTGFDPEGLERAAKAARDLDNSKNATAAIELIKVQEQTKQHESAAKRAEMEAYTQQQRAANIENEAAQARKTLDAQTQHEKQRLEYHDQLERKRQVDMLNAQKYMQEYVPLGCVVCFSHWLSIHFTSHNISFSSRSSPSPTTHREQLKKQEEMVARQEEMRRKTAAYEAELRTKTEVAKEKAKAEGRIAQERANYDLILSKVRLEAAEQRDTVLKAIQDSGTLIGNGIAAYLNDTTKLRNTALTITGIAVGVITARTTIGIAGRTIEARLGKPNLIRETSITTVSQWFKQPYETITKMISKSNKSNENDALQGIIMEPSLDVQLRKIALSTSNTKKNRAPFRHLLLHGPPGTGKTLFARNLAQHSGLDYAILTGGDIAPLGRDAVTELHKLFDWAKTSRRGLLLFVDEADAFLQSRATSKLSEDQRNALNAFLFRTGTESDQFMMVYASNQPAQFDEAVLDRVDEMVSFDLPGPNERRKMIAHYIDKYLLNPPSTWTRKVETVDIGDAEIERVVKETEGFSGRAISKLAIAWQAAAYGTENAILDQETFFRTVQQQKDSIDIKQTWLQQAQTRAKLLTLDA